MPSLDANVVLRWLLDDVPEQTRAVEDLLASGSLFRLSDVALVEVAFVLERSIGLSRSRVADNLEAVLALGAIEIAVPVWRTAVRHYRTHPKLSIADCFLAAAAASTDDAPLLTFDAKLARQVPGVELIRWQ